jgi:SAM-dependent methyltransferase
VKHLSLDSGAAPRNRAPRICDYEGSDYRRRFWEDADRSFEDAAERLALRRLLPAGGRRLAEIGAGYGRLADEYDGFEDVILVDYARSMLGDARSRLGDRYRYVCADLYRLPFASSALDAVVQVRVLHHVEDVPAAFAEVARVLAAGGSYVLEFANKRNLKARARHLAGRQAEDPNDPAPHEFVPLNWNFHPHYVEDALADAGLAVRERRAASHFRLPALKSSLPAGPLARLDALLGGPLAGLALAPSQFLRAAKLTGEAASVHLWRCPACGEEPIVEAPEGGQVPCPRCGRGWPIEDGVYVFR